MTKAIIAPSTINGTLTAPASKSAMQRACAAALIRKGETILQNPGISADDQAALQIIQALGATVQQEGDTLRVRSKGVRPVGNELHCGESGLSIRMFTSIAAGSASPIRITGSGSLLKRPMQFFDEVLPRLGVKTESRDGFLPLTVQGPLKPEDIGVDGSLSSQFLTGLLMAYAAADASDVTIRVTNLNSRPYIDLTLQVMEKFGLKTPVNQGYTAFYFSPGSDPAPVHDPLHFAVEGDWSGAAFLLVAGAVGGNMEVRGLDIFSAQADRAILQALMQSGANMSIQEERITVQTGSLKPFHFNATQCPDLFPPLVALAAFCEGRSVIEGVHRLTHKESNRAATLQEEFGKLGVSVQLQDDLMIIEGSAGVKSARVHSHHDHRIAMACAVAALRADGPVEVEGAEAVNKSYPQFWQHLQDISVPVSLMEE